MLFKVLFPPFCFRVCVHLLYNPTIPLLDNQNSQDNQNHASTRTCLVSIHNSIIHNGQRVGTAEKFKEQTDKQDIIYVISL